MNKAQFYANKPAACSSPIVQKINGKLYRVHDGHYPGSIAEIAPSRYPAELEDITAIEQNNKVNNLDEVFAQ